MFDNLPFPSLFVCFLIFILWLHYEKRKSSREEKKRSDEFWQREEAANCARNKDISKLPMFEPDMEQVPMPESSDENICYYQNRVIEQSRLPMMDLSEYSNTDLKLAYGVGNFKTLSQYDENFNDFLMNMSNLGKAYHKGELLEEAAAVYRCCLNSGSDKSTRSMPLWGPEGNYLLSQRKSCAQNFPAGRFSVRNCGNWCNEY